MSLFARIRRWLCRDCLRDERHPALVSLERTNAALDRLSGEVRRIRAEMAADDNPVLGEPPRVPRRGSQ